MPLEHSVHLECRVYEGRRINPKTGQWTKDRRYCWRIVLYGWSPNIVYRELVNLFESLEKGSAMTTTATAQLPSVCRIVHYIDRDEVIAAKDQDRPVTPYAAVITRVHPRADSGEPDTRVGLNIFHPENGIQVMHDVEFGDGPNQWHWPPVVGARVERTADKAGDPPAATAKEATHTDVHAHSDKKK